MLTWQGTSKDAGRFGVDLLVDAAPWLYYLVCGWWGMALVCCACCVCCGVHAF